MNFSKWNKARATRVSHVPGRKLEDVGAPNPECRATVTAMYVHVLDETQLGQVLGWTCTSFRERPSNDPDDAISGPMSY